jgi:hypothetical protein
MRVTLTNTIKGFILAKPELADNDTALVWAIWDWELKRITPPKNILKMSAQELVQLWQDKTITSPSAIGRSRRKCQELYPETRGEIYEARHKEQEVVKADLQAAGSSPEGFTEGSPKPLSLR